MLLYFISGQWCDNKNNIKLKLRTNANFTDEFVSLQYYIRFIMMVRRK